jgi:hypothetical protein
MANAIKQNLEMLDILQENKEEQEPFDSQLVTTTRAYS